MLLYTTQRCFGGSFSSVRPRVIGECVLTSSVETMKRPYVLDDRVFPLGCTIDLISLVPRDAAPDFADLAPRLHAFKGAWHLRLRSAPVPLDEHDYQLIRSELTQARPPQEVLHEYVP
jgi:hypothetical protein